MAKTPLTVEIGLLGFFQERARYGYEIFQEISQPSGLGLVWRLKQSHLYALLDRLESEGCLSGCLEYQESRPARKLFTLTNSGLHAFRTWIEEPVLSGREMRMQFQAKLYFASQLDEEVLSKLITRQRSACQDWYNSMVVQADNLPKDNRFDRLVFRYRIQQVSATISWLDECAQQFPLSRAQPLIITKAHPHEAA
jgi:DNA-binding PadR family transcriptional regulator